MRYGIRNVFALAIVGLMATRCGGGQAPTRPSTTSPVASIAVAGPAESVPISGGHFGAATIAPSLSRAASGSAATVATAPGAPSDLNSYTITGTDGHQHIVDWRAPVDGGPPTSYVIEAGSAPGLSDLANFDTGNTGTTFNADVVLGTYYVRVRARNAAGTSPPSNEIRVTASGCRVPSPPTGLTSAVVSLSRYNSLTLSWNPIADVFGYSIRWGVDPANLRGGISAGTNNSLTTAVTGPATLYASVHATNACGTGPPSPPIEIALPQPPCLLGNVTPPPPTGLSASVTGSTVMLTWSAPTTTCAPSGYIVESGSSSGLSNLSIVSTGSRAPTFSASGVANGTYYIRVRAVSDAGTSVRSNEVTVTVGGPAPCASAPGAPSGLSVSVNGSSLMFTWSAPVGGCAATGYVLEAGSSTGASNLANFSTGSTATIFSRSEVASGIYYVRVRAANAAGVSGPSNEVVVIVGGSTPSPTSVTGRWVGVTPDGWILDPGTDSCDLEWDLQLDLTQSGTAVTGTATTRVRKVARPGCDPIGLVETASLLSGTVGSGTISFTLPGDRGLIIYFSGTFTATRMAGTMTAFGSRAGSFAVNRQ